MWTGVTDRFVVNQNEFFNRSVGPIYYVGGATPGGLAETEVRVDEGDGSVRLADGSALDAPYVLLESTISPDGSVVARDPALGVTLWRLDEPLVSTKTEITGLYPNDTWSGPTGHLRPAQLPRRHAERRALQRSDAVRESRRPIVARVGGRVGRGVRLEPDGMATIRVPLRPVGGDCRVVFDVSPTKVPEGRPARRSARTSTTSSSAGEDRVRRQPALASAHRDRQLRAGLARGARRGGRRAARRRRLRADAAPRAQADPRGARRRAGRAADGRAAVLARLPDGLEPRSAARPPSASSAGSTCSTSATGSCRRSAAGSARRWFTTSSRSAFRSG